MNFGLKKPCRECPFRADCLKGYLGPDTGSPEAFVRPVMGSRELMPGVWVGGEPQDTACHMDIDRAREFVKREFDIADPDPDDLEQYGVKLQHCAGALHFLNAICKLPHDREKVAAMERVKPDVPMIESFEGFIAHHTMKSIKPARSASAPA